MKVTRRWAGRRERTPPLGAGAEVQREPLATARRPAAFCSGLWPRAAAVMSLNEEFPGANPELKQTEILSGFCHLFCTCH